MTMAPGGETPRGNPLMGPVSLHCECCDRDLEPRADWPDMCPLCGGPSDCLDKR
jgi:hypothetical protein